MTNGKLAAALRECEETFATVMSSRKQKDRDEHMAAIARLEAAAREEGRNERHPSQYADLRDFDYDMAIAAARLAGRIEQAERTLTQWAETQDSHWAASWLEKELACLRREAGK